MLISLIVLIPLHILSILIRLILLIRRIPILALKAGMLSVIVEGSEG